MYRLYLNDRTRYDLDDEGYVVARTDGPKGWNYGKGWRIVGFRTRHNALRVITLRETADGANIGQGWVVDWDHGTYRMWGSPSDHRATLLIHIPDLAVIVNGERFAPGYDKRTALYEQHMRLDCRQDCTEEHYQLAFGL